MSSQQSFHSVCANPFHKEKHERCTDLRPVTEVQQLAFLYLPKDIKICNECRKECRKINLQPSGVVEEPDVRTEEAMEEVSDFY